MNIPPFLFHTFFIIHLLYMVFSFYNLNITKFVPCSIKVNFNNKTLYVSFPHTRGKKCVCIAVIFERKLFKISF